MQAAPAMNQRRQAAAPGSLRRIFGYLREYRVALFIAYTALTLSTLTQLAVPQITQQMIDSVTDGVIAANLLAIPDADAQAGALAANGLTLAEVQSNADNAESLLVNAALLIVAFALMRGFFAFFESYMAEYTSQSVAFSLRNAIFTRIQRLSFSYYDQHQTGQLMIRATDDVERVRLFIAQGAILALQALLLLVFAFGILFTSNWQLTLAIIPVLIAAFVVFMIFGRLAQPLFRDVQIRLSALNTVLQENVAGIRVVQAFVRQPLERQRFEKTNTDLYQQWITLARVFAILFPLIFLVAQIGQAVILFVAGNQIIDGSISIGDYQKFTLYLVYIFFPLGQLGLIISLMAQAATSSERIFEILDAKSEITDKPGAVALPAVRGDLEFRNVTFRYFNSSGNILTDVSFTAQAGETIALLGATGSGKTTIINLIPRFYDVSEGAVLIDGHDLRDVKLDSVRSQIGIVLQETNLFSGTIRDNIAFGRSDASMEEVQAAAKAAAAHDFIMEFPDGYNTHVGERGATLSGGQKQRIAIARALLLKPNILILDDSTSSVDFATERKIQAALDTLMRGRTSFVIAQRISTVRNADRIIVLEKGRIAALGTHDELLETSPIYAEIFHSQLVDDTQHIEEETRS